jgi:hypothetical protein
MWSLEIRGSTEIDMRAINLALDVVDDLAEYVADRRTENRKDNDNHDSDEDQNQRIFDQALAFLLQFPKHGIHLLSLGIDLSMMIISAKPSKSNCRNLARRKKYFYDRGFVRVFFSI